MASNGNSNGNAIFLNSPNGDVTKGPTSTTEEMPSTNPPPAVYSSLKPGVTHLSKTDLDAVRLAIGAPPISYEDSTPTSSSPKAATKSQKTIPDGLYKTALKMLSHSTFRYYFIMILYNVSLLLQLLLGAALTGLGSTTNSNGNGVAITILAAANTVNAGLIGLLHNSGMPNRFRSDMNEYEKVVEYLQYLMRSGVVGVGETRDDVIQKCFDMYGQARATVEKNQPGYYVGPKPSTTGEAPASQPPSQ
ncbi:uncharacterized protein PAC_07782 [Phialocephala subalpina]|uniref:SMODS and SLOG-associating 2TM effector domain-containing protein n=1 Tax=Phialocephala subalpina TaxID=576137 RepID=A0A1L7WYP8_9HELO|nr:uncharacterized protein PAC_07782 [Phialocephala subalpina]